MSQEFGVTAEGDLGAPVPANEIDRLQAARRLGLFATAAEERFDRFARLAANIFRAQMALITIVDADKVWFKAAVGHTAQWVSRKDSFCAFTVAADTLLIIEDTLQDARVQHLPLVTGEPFVRFYAGAPLHGPGGHVVGTLCVMDSRPRPLDQAELATLQALASAVEYELTAESEQRMAIELAANRAAVARQMETLRSALNAAEEAMLIFAQDGTLLDANQRAADFFGTALAPYIGHSYRELAPLTEHMFVDPVAVMARWDDMFASTDDRFVYDLEQKSPQHRLLLLTSAPLLGAQDRIWGRLIAFYDITAQQQVDRLRYEFMEALSANLRGPLTTVKGYVDLMLEEGLDPLTAMQREMLGVVQQNADEMVETIEELVDVALLSATQSQMQRTYIDLYSLLESLLRTRFSGERAALRVDFSSDLAKVYADPDALNQIMRTALKGALYYVPERTQVDIDADDADGHILLRIGGLQTPVGGLLPAERADRPALELAQLELAMACSILKQQGGDMTVSGAPGCTTLVLRLPKGPA